MKKNKNNKIIVDHIYENQDISKFINIIMKNGKKEVAEKILYDSFFLLKKRKKNPLKIFEKAIDNITPLVEIRTRQIAGTKYNIPTEIKESRRKMLAFKYLLEEINANIRKNFPARLVDELLLAYKNEGSTVKKVQNIHKMAESNRVFINNIR